MRLYLFLGVLVSCMLALAEADNNCVIVAEILKPPRNYYEICKGRAYLFTGGIYDFGSHDCERVCEEDEDEEIEYRDRIEACWTWNHPGKEYCYDTGWSLEKDCAIRSKWHTYEREGLKLVRLIGRVESCDSSRMSRRLITLKTRTGVEVV